MGMTSNKRTGLGVSFPARGEEGAVRQVRAVLFDFDGTLTLPGHIDFAEIRAAIGCPVGKSLLSYIESLEEPELRAEANEVLERFESEAADRAKEDPDAAEIVRFCQDRGFRMGIITRNSKASLDRSFAHFSGIRIDDFGTVITRDDPVEAKPAPDGVQLACRHLGVAAEETVLVGDYLYDIEAGKRAGAITVFYDSDPGRSFDRPKSDYSIGRLSELQLVLTLYLPLPAGKVPNELLARFLSSGLVETTRDGKSSLIVGPGVGEDVAAVSLSALRSGSEGGAADDVLLLKSDPITFVAEDLARYLLTVNANDIATSGGTPRWLLATLIAPPGTLPVEIGRLFVELRASCAALGVELCGGHTELSDAVTRAIVSGTMIGTVAEGRLVRKDRMRSGDAVVLTKAVAIEGSAILASEHASLLRDRGVAEELIRRAMALRERMSILPEAGIAAAVGRVTAMHDVTEGGLSTALDELSIAGKRRLRVDIDKIPILPETSTFCSALGLDPLGLIGSGSLIICVRPDSASTLLARLKQSGVPATVIGTVLQEGEGLEAMRGGQPTDMPRFAADEITRLYR